MNQVSWLIYLSNISGNLGALFVFFGICIAVVTCIYFGYSFFLHDKFERWEKGAEVDACLKEAAKIRARTPYWIALSFVFFILAAFTPDQETVLAIAASQVGEQLLKTPTANLAEQALDAWLKRQITDIQTTHSATTETK